MQEFLSPTKKKLQIIFIMIVISFIYNVLFSMYDIFIKANKNYLLELAKFDSILEILFLMFSLGSRYGYSIEDLRWLHSTTHSPKATVYIIGSILYWYIASCFIASLEKKREVVVKKTKR